MIFNFTYKNIARIASIPSIIKFTNRTNGLLNNANTIHMSKMDCIISFDVKASNYFKENSEEMEKILKRVHDSVWTMKGKQFKHIDFDEEQKDLFSITKDEDGSLQVIDKDDNVLNILYIQHD